MNCFILFSAAFIRVQLFWNTNISKMSLIKLWIVKRKCIIHINRVHNVCHAQTYCVYQSRNLLTIKYYTVLDIISKTKYYWQHLGMVAYINDVHGKLFKYVFAPESSLSKHQRDNSWSYYKRRMREFGLYSSRQV